MPFFRIFFLSCFCCYKFTVLHILVFLLYAQYKSSSVDSQLMYSAKRHKWAIMGIMSWPTLLVLFCEVISGKELSRLSVAGLQKEKMDVHVRLCLCTMALSCSLINKWIFSVDLIIPKHIDQASRGSRSSSRLLLNSVVTCTFACLLYTSDAADES